MAGHITKRVLDAVSAALSGAGITVMVDGSPLAVNVLADPPVKNKLDPSQLPALFVFAGREQIEPSSAGRLGRDLQASIVMLAQPASEVTGQLFEMQLAVEKALAASDRLGGLAFDLYPVSADQVLDRGEAIHGARSVDYLIRCSTPFSDPSQ